MCGTVYGIYQLTMVSLEPLLAVIVNETAFRASLSGSNLADTTCLLPRFTYKHLLCMKYRYCGRNLSQREESFYTVKYNTGHIIQQYNTGSIKNEGYSS
jgi:hypothetical protein